MNYMSTLNYTHVTISQAKPHIYCIIIVSVDRKFIETLRFKVYLSRAPYSTRLGTVYSKRAHTHTNHGYKQHKQVQSVATGTGRKNVPRYGPVFSRGRMSIIHWIQSPLRPHRWMKLSF